MGFTLVYTDMALHTYKYTQRACSWIRSANTHIYTYKCTY